VGCLGAHLLIADMQKAGIKPRYCIVGEPTLMLPVIAHKGIQGFHCALQGVAAHSSLTPKGCNAIEYAARLIDYLRKMADRFKQRGPFDLHFDVPFTTISTNMIQGGQASNIIPSDCEFFFEFRHLPEVNPQDVIEKLMKYVSDDLLPKMKKENAAAHIAIDNFAGVPSFAVSEDSSFFHLLSQVCGTRETKKVAYATEAGLFQQANMQTIVLGPGSIEQAHRANEYVTIEQLKKCETILRKVVASVCENPS
jgi:acetylornithine deacetylase